MAHHDERLGHQEADALRAGLAGLGDVLAGQQRRVANAIGRPTSSGCPTDPVMISDVVNRLARGSRATRDNGSTTSYMNRNTMTPYNKPQTTGRSTSRCSRRLARWYVAAQIIATRQWSNRPAEAIPHQPLGPAAPTAML
jgi:hypothetical protein